MPSSTRYHKGNTTVHLRILTSICSSLGLDRIQRRTNPTNILAITTLYCPRNNASPSFLNPHRAISPSVPYFRSESFEQILHIPKMRTSTIVSAVLAAAYPVFVNAATTTESAATATSSGVEEASAAPTLGAQVVQGCFSSYGDLIFNSTPTFNSKSACAFDICYALKYAVAATSAGNECYCGSEYPPEEDLTKDTNCNTPCPGYGLQACQYLHSCLSLEFASNF